MSTPPKTEVSKPPKKEPRDRISGILLELAIHYRAWGYTYREILGRLNQELSHQYQEEYKKLEAKGLEPPPFSPLSYSNVYLTLKKEQNQIRLVEYLEENLPELEDDARLAREYLRSVVSNPNAHPVGRQISAGKLLDHLTNVIKAKAAAQIGDAVSGQMMSPQEMAALEDDAVAYLDAKGESNEDRDV